MNALKSLLKLFLLNLFILSLFINGTFSILYSQNVTAEIIQLKNEAKYFEEQAKYKDALTSLQKILAKRIDDSEKYNINLWMSRILEKAGQISSNENIEVLKSALHVQKTDTVHYKLGIAYLNAGMISSAKSEFENARMLNPRNFYANFQLGKISLEKDVDCNQAIQYFEEALKIIPNQIDALLYLGLSYKVRAREGDIKKAINYLEVAKTKSPRSYEILISLADIYLKQNNLEGALTNYNEALSVTLDFKQKERAQRGIDEINRRKQELESQRIEWQQLESQFNQAQIMTPEKTEAFLRLNRLRESDATLTQQLDRLKLTYWNQLMQQGRQQCRLRHFPRAVELFREAEIYAIDENTRNTASNAKSEAMANRELQVDFTQIYQEARNNLDQRPQDAIEQFTALRRIMPGRFIPVDEVNPRLNQAYYNMGKNSYNQQNWFSTITFLSMIPESDDENFPNRKLMIETAKRQIPLDYLVNGAKNLRDEGKLDSSFWLLKAAFLLNSDNDEIHQLLRQLCIELGDRALENEDWINSISHYQFLLKYIDEKNSHASEQLQKAKENLSWMGILKKWQFWSIFLLILIGWPLFWHVRYASNIKRISIWQYIKDSKLIQLRKKINKKHARIIITMWLGLALIIIILLVKNRRPTTVHLDFDSSMIKLHFNEEHKLNKSFNSYIQNLSASSIKVFGLKEMSLNGIYVENYNRYMSNNSRASYIIKPQTQGGAFEITFRPVTRNITIAKFGIPSGSYLMMKPINANDKLLPIKFKAKNSQNCKIMAFLGPQIEIELSSCIIYQNNTMQEFIRAGEIKILRAQFPSETNQMLLTFASNNSSGLNIRLIDPEKPVEFNSFDICNIDFYDEMSHESCIINGNIEYSGFTKSNTKIYKGYSLTLDSKNLMMKFMQVNKDIINSKFKAIAKSLKWERDIEEIQKSGIEEIPTYFDWFIKKQTTTTIILILSWFIPVLLAYLELKSRRDSAVNREALKPNLKKGRK